MEPDHQKRIDQRDIRHQLIIHTCILHSLFQKKFQTISAIFQRQAEALGQLHPAQLEIIYKQNWFNLFVPKEHGGLGLHLKEGLQIQEGLAWTDGSAGWTVTLCSGANYFIGFLSPEVAKEIFKDPHVCLAGSGHPSGIARKIKERV